MQRALILFAHGARDPNWAAPFLRLRELTQARLPDVRVELAFLELMMPNLPGLAQSLMHEGCDEMTIVPVFLGQGGHVRRDLPLLIEQIQKSYPGLVLKVAVTAGEDEKVLNAIACYCSSQIE